MNRTLIPLFYPPKVDLTLLQNELFGKNGTFPSRWWGQGPKVDKFEKIFSKKFGFKYSVMTNSGTSALHLAYILAGLKEGDEVIVPVLTCTATCHPLLYLKTKIIFADIRQETLTLDPEDFEKKITPKTKAVVIVHLGGLVENREEIKKIAKRHRLKIIEDACQALGAKGVGFGDYTCFSFQAIKALTTGDGGMLCCKKKEDYEKALRLRWFDIDRKQKAKRGWQAWDRRGITFDQKSIGYKYQPTDIDASIAIAGIQNFDENQKHRENLVSIYRENLKNVKGLQLLKEGESSNWLFMVKVDKRNDFASFLLNHGIETNVGHIRNDLFTIFGGKRLNLSNMNAIEKKYICLPLNTKIGAKDVIYICDTIKKWSLSRKK